MMCFTTTKAKVLPAVFVLLVSEVLRPVVARVPRVLCCSHENCPDPDKYCTTKTLAECENRGRLWYDDGSGCRRTSVKACCRTSDCTGCAMSNHGYASAAECNDAYWEFISAKDANGNCENLPSPITKTSTVPRNSSMGGDPHIQTWNRSWFDFHGMCDLVYLQAPTFEPHKPLSIHVRTTARYSYSYIESAALQIGHDVLEVTSWGDYAVNGVTHANLQDKQAANLEGFPIHHHQVSDRQHAFDVVIGKSENITISTFKDLVSVKITGGTRRHFGDSVGLLGSFDGTMLARNGTEMSVATQEAINAFGQEWQVRSTEEDEPMLFRTIRAPQHPDEACVLPKETTTVGRRLGEGLARAKALEACARFHHESGPALDACVFDVMATGDVDVAEAGQY